MALNDLIKEIEYHELMLETILEYKNNNGICKVSQMEIAKRINKNHPWVGKAVHRLNAEDNCIEMIKKGEYRVHYTNIRERGVFPKIATLIVEMTKHPETFHNEIRLHEKYKISKKTANIFKGYLALIYK